MEEFIACPHNLANNRQVRMLANLSLVGCYDPNAMSEDQRNRVLLDSAKANLRKMAFFGLTEYQRETQYMFERTFHLSFMEDFVQYNKTHARSIDIPQNVQEKVTEINKLDIELYAFAKQLFFARLQKLYKEDEEERTKEGGLNGNSAKLSKHLSDNGIDAQSKLPHRTVDYEEGDENYEDDDDDDFTDWKHVHRRNSRNAKHVRRKHKHGV